MRQIVLDTETTGLEPSHGHRIIEIGAVELVNRNIVGNFHSYLNPQREVDKGAQAVHGLSSEFLADKPLFTDIHQKFLNFIKGAELIIHNAAFDLGFLDKELELLNPKLGKITDYCPVLCTLTMARKRHPGQKNNLDALCKRYSVDNSRRERHGALLDAEILAAVYLAMTGGQANLFESDKTADNITIKTEIVEKLSQDKAFDYKIIRASTSELEEHSEYVKMLADKSGVKLWEEQDS